MFSKVEFLLSSVRVPTDGQTDGRYQIYYLSCFVVDKHGSYREQNSPFSSEVKHNVMMWHPASYSFKYDDGIYTQSQKNGNIFEVAFLLEESVYQ